jgi:transcriptional antiterminator RfaH
VYWVVISKAHAESVAAKTLAGKLYDVYCPMILSEIRHANRSELVPRPFLPRYLFVRVKQGGVRGVLSTTGVSSLLSFGDTPAVTPDSVVEEIRAREVDGLIKPPEPVQKPFPFKQGDSVKVASELMGEIDALFSCRQGPGRVRVLINMLGRWHKATVPLGAVYSNATA